MTTDPAYEAFLAKKAVLAPPVGITPPMIVNQYMFPFQDAVTRWALRRGAALIGAGTGMGKTLIQVSWASVVREHTRGPVLILAPLAVGHQTAEDEAPRWGISDIAYTKNQAEVKSSIVVTNYERVEEFDPAKFSAIVLDECFAPGTAVDTPNGPIYIQNIKDGQEVFNCSGIDTIIKTHKREVPFGVKIETETASFIASPNHPIFTERGWVAAQSLRTGDYALATGAAMRLVREGVFSDGGRASSAAVLRETLLGEMADEHTRAQSEGSQSEGGSEARSYAGDISAVGRSESDHRKAEDGSAEPMRRSNCVREDGGDLTEDRPSAEDSRWQRTSADQGTSSPHGAPGFGMDGEIRCLSWSKEAGVSDELQNRYSESEPQNWYRGGRKLSSITQGAGSEEGCCPDFVRVDRVEVLELGHPELDRCRDADGKLYFYDLQALRHPSFSVGGILVHNSSIIKSHDSKTRATLMEMFSQTAYKLCCTATPAPNDYVELGQHAEFLGVMSQKEMLATFFVHDGGIRATDVNNKGGKPVAEWRLKRHAEKDFWKWLASWAVMFQHPSDLGFNQPGYDLPPLYIEQITVATEHSIANTGQLFPTLANTLQERLHAKRDSIPERAAAAAKLIQSAPDESWLIWCHLNDEADALRALVPSIVEVRGPDHPDLKTQRLLGFIRGDVNHLLSKVTIAGFGLNMQRCNREIFLGLNDSYEQLYQAIRRCWRFGQTREVTAYLIASDREGNVVANLRDKETQAQAMMDAMMVHMRDLSKAAIRTGRVSDASYHPTKKMEIPTWLAAE